MYVVTWSKWRNIQKVLEARVSFVREEKDQYGTGEDEEELYGNGSDLAVSV